jgi:hypothetical protein
LRLHNCCTGGIVVQTSPLLLLLLLLLQCFEGEKGNLLSLVFLVQQLQAQPNPRG